MSQIWTFHIFQYLFEIEMYAEEDIQHQPDGSCIIGFIKLFELWEDGRTIDPFMDLPVVVPCKNASWVLDVITFGKVTRNERGNPVQRERGAILQLDRLALPSGINWIPFMAPLIPRC